MKFRTLGIALIAVLNGCSFQQVLRVARNDTLDVPISLENPSDSGDAIHRMWVSFATPNFIIPQSTSALLGPRRLEIGESWTPVGRFMISSSAPLGCTGLAYSISTSSEDVTYPNYNDELPTTIKLLVTPEKSNFWLRATVFPRKAACALKPLGRNRAWSWSYPPPTDRIPPLIPTKRNLRLVADAKPLVGLPRGNFGFVLGATLSEAEENAKSRGLWPVPGTNDSVKPDEWRYFEVTRDPRITTITMFLREGTISQLNISYEADSNCSFDCLKKQLRADFGPEVAAGSGESYWADGQTVIALRDRQVQYHDLSRSSRMRFTRIGGGQSYFFFPQRGYVDVGGP